MVFSVWFCVKTRRAHTLTDSEPCRAMYAPSKLSPPENQHPATGSCSMVHDTHRHSTAVASVRIVGKTDWVQLHRASTVPANRAGHQSDESRGRTFGRASAKRFMLAEMWPCGQAAVVRTQRAADDFTRHHACCNPCESPRIA